MKNSLVVSPQKSFWINGMLAAGVAGGILALPFGMGALLATLLTAGGFFGVASLFVPESYWAQKSSVQELKLLAEAVSPKDRDQYHLMQQQIGVLRQTSRSKDIVSQLEAVMVTYLRLANYVQVTLDYLAQTSTKRDLESQIESLTLKIELSNDNDEKRYQMAVKELTDTWERVQRLSSRVALAKSRKISLASSFFEAYAHAIKDPTSSSDYLEDFIRQTDIEEEITMDLKHQFEAIEDTLSLDDRLALLENELDEYDDVETSRSLTPVPLRWKRY